MKIVVIEDHKLVRDMLVLTCGNVAGGAEVRGAANGHDGVALCGEFQPDLVFLDLALPDGDGIDFLPRIRAACPSTKVIALTSHPDEFTIHRALRAQVNGFVDKNDQPLEVLKEAIVTVMEGRWYLSAAAQRVRMTMREDPADFSKVLSEHEQRLLGLIGVGLSNEEVARKLGISAGTVKIHRINIMNKLGIHSTPHLMLYALEKGFTRFQGSVRPVASEGGDGKEA